MRKTILFIISNTRVIFTSIISTRDRKVIILSPRILYIYICKSELLKQQMIVTYRVFNSLPTMIKQKLIIFCKKRGAKHTLACYITIFKWIMTGSPTNIITIHQIVSLTGSMRCNTLPMKVIGST